MVVDFDVLRHLGGRNFRDLGGRPANSGRRVRRQKIYRSAHLADVPAESPLNSLELTTLVTLQSRIEVSFLGPPKREILSRVRWEHIPIGETWFTDEGFTRIDAEPGLVHLALVTQFRADWQRFFKLLAERDVYPLLFHCSAGRDRTGVGAAMLLSLLGVGRDFGNNFGNKGSVRLEVLVLDSRTGRLIPSLTPQFTLDSDGALYDRGELAPERQPWWPVRVEGGHPHPRAELQSLSRIPRSLARSLMLSAPAPAMREPGAGASWQDACPARRFSARPPHLRAGRTVCRA